MMRKKSTYFLYQIISLFLFQATSLLCVAQQKVSTPGSFEAKIAGTNMLLTIPAGFTALEDGSGYLHAGSASSILIADLPGSSYQSVVMSMEKGQVSKDGSTLTATEKLRTSAGAEAIIYTLSFTAKSKDGKQDIPFERMIFLTGDENHTLWITANYPAVIKKYIEGEIRKCMISVRSETE